MEKIAESFQYRMLAELPDIPASAQAIPQAPFINLTVLGLILLFSGLVNSTVPAIVWIIALEVGKRTYQWKRDVAVCVFEQGILKAQWSQLQEHSS